MCQTFSACPSLANVNPSQPLPESSSLLFPPPTTTYPATEELYVSVVLDQICSALPKFWEYFCTVAALTVTDLLQEKIFVFHFWFNLFERKFSGDNQCLCCFLLISRLDSLVQISSCWTAAHLDCDGVAALSKTRSILHWQLTQHKLFW